MSNRKAEIKEGKQVGGGDICDAGRRKTWLLNDPHNLQISEDSLIDNAAGMQFFPQIYDKGVSAII
jgi:hypothetical protein